MGLRPQTFNNPSIRSVCLSVCLRTTLLWVITQRAVVISYRRFGTTHRSHPQGSTWPLKIGCPETSVRNYHYSLRNDPEERSSRLLRGGSLKSRISVCPSVCARHKSSSIINTSLKYFVLLFKMITECDVPSIPFCINSLLLMHYLGYSIRWLLYLSLNYGNCNKRQLLHNIHKQENLKKKPIKHDTLRRLEFLWRPSIHDIWTSDGKHPTDLHVVTITF